MDPLAASGLSLQTEMSTTIWLRSCLESRRLAHIQFQSTWRVEKYPGTVRAKSLYPKIMCLDGLLIAKQLLFFPLSRYCLNKAGLNSVKKLLLCIGNYFPNVNFCPIVPALVSLLLHFSEDEAECFHSVSRLICFNDPNKRYVDQTFLTYRASCMTFGDLANRCCRGIRKLIASSHQNLFEFYSDWITWIFADLPFTYAIRVLDVYLLEGYKVLYRFVAAADVTHTHTFSHTLFVTVIAKITWLLFCRVALVLLGLYKVSVSSRVADVEDFRTDMRNFVENISRHCTVEKLLEDAFMIPMATRRELNLLFNANKDSLTQKGISIHQKRWDYTKHVRGTKIYQGYCSQACQKMLLYVIYRYGKHSYSWNF